MTKCIFILEHNILYRENIQKYINQYLEHCEILKHYTNGDHAEIHEINRIIEKLENQKDDLESSISQTLSIFHNYINRFFNLIISVTI